MKRHTRDQLPHVLSQVALAALATVIVASLLLATVGPNSFGDVVGRLGRLARTQAGQLAAPAPVPPSGPQYGAHAPMAAPYTDQQETQTLDDAQASGAGWVRFQLSWRAINAQPGQYTFAHTDSLVRQANQRGLKVLGIIMDTPAWASSAPGCPANCGPAFNRYPPENYADWQTFVRTLATHYAQGCASDPTLCVAAYEIWNEPTQATFWHAGPSDYAHLLSVAADAIHAADTRALVFNGGLVDNPNNNPITRPLTVGSKEAWVQAWLGDPSYPTASKLDGVAVHIRGPLSTVLSLTTSWRTLFNQYPPLASKPLWVTEHGYPSTFRDQTDPEYRGTDAASGETAQASYYAASVPGMLSAGAQAVFVTTTDGLDPQQSSSFAHEGLVRSDLVSRKPSFATWMGSNGSDSGTAPSAPTNLAVASAGYGRILLNWTDTATNETGYVVERKAGSGSYAQVGSTLPANTETFTDTSVTPFTTYSYRVKAINGVLSSAYSNALSVKSYSRNEDSSPNVKYTGVWKARFDRRLSGGTAQHSTDPNGAASLTWNGTDVNVVMTRGPQMGKAYVVVDGAFHLVDLYSPTTAYQQVVYSATRLPSGMHTVKISPSGLKNSASGGTTVALDALDTR